MLVFGKETPGGGFWLSGLKTAGAKAPADPCTEAFAALAVEALGVTWAPANDRLATAAAATAIRVRRQSMPRT
jgi:hypothetical protein